VDVQVNRLGRKMDFFFQAEDGIRAYKVTGVQTCALPIFTKLLAEVRPHGLKYFGQHRGGRVIVQIDSAHDFPSILRRATALGRKHVTRIPSSVSLSSARDFSSRVWQAEYNLDGLAAEVSR